MFLGFAFLRNIGFSEPIYVVIFGEYNNSFVIIFTDQEEIMERSIEAMKEEGDMLCIP